MSFAPLLAGAKRSDNGFTLAIPEDWHQGRTAYGGFSAALAIEAARHAAGDGLPPLRSAQVSFVGPLYGAVEARGRVLRRGRNATWIAAEIVREGEVGLAATFVFMGPVGSTTAVDDRPLPADLIPLENAAPFTMQHSPVFLRTHFEARFARPRSAEKRPEVCMWIRPRERVGLDGTSELVLTADALPPGLLPLVAPGTPVSSMTWQMNLLTAEPHTRDGWWLLRARSDFAERGCSSEPIDIWNADGKPVMGALQSVALFS